MLDQLFNSIYSSTEVKINLLALLFSLAISLVLGIVLAKVYKHQTIYTKEFVITLSLLPTIVSMIIFLVNGNLGTSVAVAGTFSLIRFRSAAGGSKELLAIFMATAIGITTGMGFVTLGIVFTLFISLVWLLFEKMSFSSVSQTRRYVQIQIPADFDYEVLFEALFETACKSVELTSIQSAAKKTIKLDYVIDLDPEVSDRELIQQFLRYDQIQDIAFSKAAKKRKTL
ncbi:MULTISPECIES: DUF4956 domain-containing protein [Streptococcus]|uniref:DUF4956 domain-containing protein n=1 Tax=Streptococcus sinensis TaxID=176090 RepID=A0A0A0DGY0_9STRE|nr:MULTISPECIES: DUF4956 domain-containing protein [Streptococcus]KGM37118.1 hypothetical protein SSIN_1110 [Streptococcus sinensis]MCY7216706.1 DUF4956 domain-containing protein [Streptococcus cristatus]